MFQCQVKSRLLQITILAFLPAECRTYLAPDCTYVGGTPHLAPNGLYVDGKPHLVPAGSYIGTFD